jgi:hypothetical protein
MSELNVPSSGPLLNADIDAAEDIATIRVSGHEVLWISFLVGAAALTAFTVEFRLTAASDWFTVASVAADYTTPSRPILDASGSLVTAASGATVHWAEINVKGVHSVRLRAAGTSSTLTGHWSAL